MFYYNNTKLTVMSPENKVVITSGTNSRLQNFHVSILIILLSLIPRLLASFLVLYYVHYVTEKLERSLGMGLPVSRFIL